MNLIPPLFMIQAFVLRLYHLTCDLGGDSRAVSPHDDRWGPACLCAPAPLRSASFSSLLRSRPFSPKLRLRGKGRLRTCVCSSLLTREDASRALPPPLPSWAPHRSRPPADSSEQTRLSFRPSVCAHGSRQHRTAGAIVE